MRIRLLHTESFRLAAIYTVIFVLSYAGLGASVLALAGAAMREQILQYADADLAAINAGFINEGVHEAQEVALQLIAATGHAGFVLLQQNGKLLAGNLPPMQESNGTFEIASPLTPNHVILGKGVVMAPGIYIFSGSDLIFVQAVQHRILTLLLWLFVGALLVAVLGGLLVSRSFLARMDTIANTCRAIMSGNLGNRIPIRGTQDELDQLAATINSMLDRIAMLMDNLRQVSSDIAHDLRTPLTHLRQRLERGRMQSLTPRDYAEAMDHAIVAADEMLSLFTALLRISQIEGGARAGFRPVDLAVLLQKTREVYKAVAEDAGHTLVVMPVSSCHIQGDEELLFQLLANLVENAIVHTPSGTNIAVALVLHEDRAVLVVSDDGPGIPAEAYNKIFRRFYRLDAARSRPGHGLGLALAAAVVELHGGSILVDAAFGSKGLVFSVSIPRNSNALPK